MTDMTTVDRSAQSFVQESPIDQELQSLFPTAMGVRPGEASLRGISPFPPGGIPEGLSQENIRSIVGQHVATSTDPAVAGMLRADGMPTQVEWDAATAKAGEMVGEVVDIADEILSAGGVATPQQTQKISQITNELADIGELQTLLGLDGTQQAQLAGVASGVANILSQASAGAILNGDAGLDHLEDILSTFTATGMVDAIAGATDTFLKQASITISNIEALNQQMIFDALGIDSVDDIPNAAPGTDPGALEMLNPEDVMRRESVFGPVFLPEEEPAEEPEADGNMFDAPSGETPFFESQFETDEPDPDAEAPVAEEESVFPLEEDVIAATDFVAAPEEEVPVEEEVAEEEAAPVFWEDLDTDDLEAVPVAEQDVEIETNIGQDVTLQVADEGETLWFERPVSPDMFKIEEMGQGVSEVYNMIVANAEDITSGGRFMETGVMTAMAGYADELGDVLLNISVEEAQNLPDVIAPLLLDLDQGQSQLEQMGMTNTPMYGATQVMTEVLGAVYYGGKMSEADPEAGIALLNTLAPSVSDFGEVMVNLVSHYNATGVMDESLQNFFFEARSAAAEIYNIAFNMNDRANTPDVETEE